MMGPEQEHEYIYKMHHAYTQQTVTYSSQVVGRALVSLTLVVMG